MIELRMRSLNWHSHAASDGMIAIQDCQSFLGAIIGLHHNHYGPWGQVRETGDDLGRHSLSLRLLNETFLFSFVFRCDANRIACKPGGLQFVDSSFGGFPIVKSLGGVYSPKLASLGMILRFSGVAVLIPRCLRRGSSFPGEPQTVPLLYSRSSCQLAFRCPLSFAASNSWPSSSRSC